jgi:autotransporter-associated beta strand protein
MGQITGNGGLSHSGTGSLTLSGTSSTYMGPTTIFGGSLLFVADSSLGAPLAPIIFGGNGTLQPLNPTTTSRSITVETGVMGTIKNDVNLTSIGPILLNGIGSNLTKTSSGTLSLQGPITGSGGITSLFGTGPWILSGNSVYTGPTSVGGEVIVNGSIQQSPVTVLKNAVLTVNGFLQSSAVSVIGGTVNVSGSFQQAAVSVTGGTVNVSGSFQQAAVSMTGGMMNVSGSFQQSPISVTNGTLNVTGSLVQSPVTGFSGALLIINGPLEQSPISVMSGALLQGTGPINPGATVNGGGTIHAGNNAIGTMTLGSLSLEPGAIMQLEVAPEQNNNSLYAVDGGVTLGGATLNVTLTQNANNYPVTQTYTFITSNSAITGTFGVVNIPAGFAAFIDYSNPHATVLRQTQVSQIGVGVNLSHNEKEVLSYLQKFSKNTALQSIFIDLASSTPDELRKTLDSISPARNGALDFFANQVSFVVGDMSVRRLGEGRMLRLMEKKERTGVKKKSLSVASLVTPENLVAMAGEMPAPNIPADLAYAGRQPLKKQKPSGQANRAAAGQDNYGFWMAGFGEFMTLKEQHKNPEIHDTTAGVLLGFNYYGIQNGIFSASAGYIHNRITEDQHTGGGKSNGFVVSAYGTGKLGGGYIEAGLLLGKNKFDLHRNIVVTGPFPFKGTASSSFDNWQLMPHIGGGYDWMTDWGFVEPFGTLDLAVSFQESYKEKGAFPLNMHVKGGTPSILRSQMGINFYEIWDSKCHICIFEQKVSYVNKSPCNTKVNAAIILAPNTFPSGSPGSFAVLSYTEVLNLAGVGVELFYKHKGSGFYLSGTYRGEFGIDYMSNDATGSLGVFF